MTRTEAFLILNMVGHVGPVTVRRLVSALGSPESVLSASEHDLRKVQGVNSAVVKSISEWEKTVPWEKELAIVQQEGLRLICQDDDEYPLHLKQIHDPPLLLYVRGKMEGAIKNSLAIVGMRHPTHYGQETARRLGYQFGNVGMTVVSGLAVGVDTQAHRGCLQAKGHTIAVLGFGFQYLPKAENAQLAKDIVENGGAVVSEFPFSRPPDRQTFPMRNRIVSGMSLGTLVVEAGGNSGALITANFALEQGRQVFAIPGRIDSPQSLGCHRLIQHGAKLVHGTEDVLEEFEFLFPRNQPPNPQVSDEKPIAETIRLTDLEQAVLRVMSQEAMPIDEIMGACDQPPAVVSATLMVLEMKHAVRQLPGKQYVKTVHLPSA